MVSNVHSMTMGSGVGKPDGVFTPSFLHGFLAALLKS